MILLLLSPFVFLILSSFSECFALFFLPLSTSLFLLWRGYLWLLHIAAAQESRDVFHRWVVWRESVWTRPERHWATGSHSSVTIALLALEFQLSSKPSDHQKWCKVLLTLVRVTIWGLFLLKSPTVMTSWKAFSTLLKFQALEHSEGAELGASAKLLEHINLTKGLCVLCLLRKFCTLFWGWIFSLIILPSP